MVVPRDEVFLTISGPWPRRATSTDSGVAIDAMPDATTLPEGVKITTDEASSGATTILVPTMRTPSI